MLTAAVGNFRTMSGVLDIFLPYRSVRMEFYTSKSTLSSTSTASPRGGGIVSSGAIIASVGAHRTAPCYREIEGEIQSEACGEGDGVFNRSDMSLRRWKTAS